MLRFPAGVVYSENGVELVEKTIMSPALIIPLSVGIGFEFQETNSGLSASFLSFVFFDEYPFNFYLLPHLVAEAGVRIRI